MRIKILAGGMAVWAALAAAALGQADLTFSGGSGTPMTLTLQMPVTYTVTANFQGPNFIFEEVGNIFAGAGFASSGTLSYSVNGGANQPLTQLASGVTVGDVSPNDVYANSSPINLSVNDVVTLNPGFLTTNSNVSGAAPAGGSFSTFLSDNNGVRTSTFGVAVPEPGVGALLIVAAAAVALFARRRNVIREDSPAANSLKF